MDIGEVVKQEEISHNPSFSINNSKNILNDVTCQVIAQMSNISNLNPCVMKPVLAAINNLAKNLVNETVFLARRGKRCMPTAYDAVSALKMRKLSVPISVTPTKLIPMKTNKQAGGGDLSLFYPDDAVIDLTEISNKEPCKVPYEPSLTEHWLSIYSVQPATPENPTPSYIYAQKKMLRQKIANSHTKNGTIGSCNNNKEGNYPTKVIDSNTRCNSVRGTLNGIALGFNGDRMPAVVIDIRPHFVGTEHQIYFKTLTEACVGNDENARNNALMTIKNDKALDPLLPHLIQFIAEGIRLNIINQNLAVLIYLVRIVRSLVDNPNVNLDPYLHRILPALLSVVLCGNICLNPITDNHFALRKFAGKVVYGICERQHTARNELVNRLCTVLVTNIKQTISPLTNTTDGKEQSSINKSNNASGDYTMRLNTLCGSLLCLSELSQEAIRQCLVPRIGAICQFLTFIIKTKGPTLPGAEDKAICQLKEILWLDKVVKALYEFRVSKNMELSQDACIRDFGNGLGTKYFDLFCKTINLRNTVALQSSQPGHYPANIQQHSQQYHHHSQMQP